MNETVGPHGLVPSLLVFGVLPEIADMTKYESPIQKGRLRAAKTTREEYEKIVAQSIVNRGLRKIPPQSSDYIYKPGDFVHVYLEGLKKYTGP